MYICTKVLNAENTSIESKTVIRVYYSTVQVNCTFVLQDGFESLLLLFNQRYKLEGYKSNIKTYTSRVRNKKLLNNTIYVFL